MENVQLVIVSLTLGEVVVCNTIFAWTFLQTNKASIMTKNNSLFIVILGEKFKLNMMVPQRSQESPKSSEILPVLLTVTIPETKNNIEERGSRDDTVELKKTVIHQCQIPVQN